MNKKNAIIALFLSNPVSANILMFSLLLGGFFSSQFMVREIFPEVNFDNISVTINYPGTDPPEIEEGISRPIEEALDGISGVKKIKTIVE